MKRRVSPSYARIDGNGSFGRSWNTFGATEPIYPAITSS